jgi:hypothetical protein
VLQDWPVWAVAVVLICAAVVIVLAETVYAKAQVGWRRLEGRDDTTVVSHQSGPEPTRARSKPGDTTVPSPPRGLAAAELAWLAGDRDARRLQELLFMELLARRAVVSDASCVRLGLTPQNDRWSPALIQMRLAVERGLSDFDSIATSLLMADRGWLHNKYVEHWVAEPLSRLDLAEEVERARWLGLLRGTKWVPSERGLLQVDRAERASRLVQAQTLAAQLERDPHQVLAWLGTLGVGLLLRPDLFPAARMVASRLRPTVPGDVEIDGLYLDELRTVDTNANAGKGSAGGGGWFDWGGGSDGGG